MTKEEERIVDENCSPHRLAKPGETPAGPQPEKVRGLPILRCPPQPDPLREPLARALAARFRERIAVAWEMGVLDSYRPVDIADLLADEVAGMFCGQ